MRLIKPEWTSCLHEMQILTLQSVIKCQELRPRLLKDDILAAVNWKWKETERETLSLYI